MTEHPAYDPVEAPPVCPRHPDRVSYVRCQRCGRPTCPECQRAAAVGVQCVDCVKAQSKMVRTGRTVFGGRVTDGRPNVTFGIMVLCGVVWLGQFTNSTFTNALEFSPDLGRTEPWRFLTAAFAHAPRQPLHILFNMYALWIMGQYLEPLLGRARYIAIYLISAVAGCACVLLLAQSPDALHQSNWYQPVVGASGAVFGLFGAFLVLNRKLGRSTAGMWVTVGINAVLGFTIPNISWQGHLGGFIAGMAAAAVVAYAGKQWSRQWTGLALLAAVVVVAAVLKYASVPTTVAF